MNNIELELGGRKWFINRAGNLDDLWEEMTGENLDDEDHIPYWTELWPASVVLADYIYQNRVFLSGKTCLDIGCGLGFTALVATWSGAAVAAMDFEFQALDFARINADLNNISQPGWIQMDWRNPGIKPGSFDIVWAADIFYETRFCAPLAEFMRYAAKGNGRIWIADPERNISLKVWDFFQENGFEVIEITRKKAFVSGQSAMVRLVELRT